MSEQQWGDRFPEIHESLEVLTRSVMMPVVLCVAGWHAPHDVELDEEAAARLAACLDEVSGREVALFLYGRGGTPGFVDAVRRLFGGDEVKLARVYVAERTLGGMSSVALAGEELVLMRGAGLGAVDRVVWPPRAGRVEAEIRAEVLGRELSGMTLDEGKRRQVELVARVRRREELLSRAVRAVAARRFAPQERERAVELCEALSAERLGEELALGERELGMLGIAARGARGEEREACARLKRAVAAQFAMRARRRASFSEAALGEEVVFEMATGEPGALVATLSSGWLYELDTGSPDPDTGLLAGEWQAL